MHKLRHWLTLSLLTSPQCCDRLYCAVTKRCPKTNTLFHITSKQPDEPIGGDLQLAAELCSLFIPICLVAHRFDATMVNTHTDTQTVDTIRSASWANKIHIKYLMMLQEASAFCHNECSVPQSAALRLD